MTATTDEIDVKLSEYVELVRSGKYLNIQCLSEMIESLDSPMSKEEYLKLLVRAIFLSKAKERIDSCKKLTFSEFCTAAVNVIVYSCGLHFIIHHFI
jgi:2-hydroxy-3-keto-5-methylthiopentenyl-1-phosphate phosphatase